jgi:hypothetical protein
MAQMGILDVPLFQLQSAIGHHPTFEISHGPDPILVFCYVSVIVIALLWLFVENFR